MGAGKSVVGRSLARRLRWRYIDLDREIERHTGRTITEIFGTEGEPAFRKLEVDLTPGFLSRTNIVFSPGGGWITNPGLLHSLPPGTLTVWLKVSPAEVLRRLSRSAAREVRPLLQSPDPAATVRDLIEKREPLYRQADLIIDTDGLSVSDTVTRLEQILQGMMSRETSTDTDVENGS
jgi:shikimate kinase